MPNFLNKLRSCIDRNNVRKNVKCIIYSESKEFFKLSRFELMPDELIIEIFEYISIIDLFNSFINLNFRLNYLLRNIHIGININQNEDKTKYLLNALYYFSKQIYYIHIDYYPLLNLTNFININSLIIYLPTKNQLLSINNKIMPNLSRLWIGIINKNDQNIICQNLFGNKQFSKLYFCYLFEINFNFNSNSFKICFNIRKLFLTKISTKDFILILLLLPNLYQFHFYLNDLLLTTINHFNHQNLRILKIEFLENISQLNYLNYIISFVPFIQQCNFIFINLIKIKDYIILQNIFIKKLFKLKQFICSIYYYCQLSSNQMINKFYRLKIKFPFFQNIKIIPCLIHQDKCLRKIFINKTLIPIY